MPQVATRVIGLLVAALLVYSTLSSYGMPRGTGLVPFISSVVGLAVLLFLAVTSSVRVRGWLGGRFMARSTQDGSSLEYGGILEALTGRGVATVFVSIVAVTALMWLVGPQVAFPVFVVAYLRRFAGVTGVVRLFAAGAGMFLLITFVYGELMRLSWPVSFVESQFGFRIQREIMAFLRGLW